MSAGTSLLNIFSAERLGLSGGEQSRVQFSSERVLGAGQAKRLKGNGLLAGAAKLTIGPEVAPRRDLEGPSVC
jgi:hypothetical protein